MQETTSQDLALNGLTKHYGKTVAVDEVTLRIQAGEMIAFLGPSGCGKTTTLRMIAGLIEPTNGEVLIGGHRLTNVPVHRRNIGMLFQNYALFPHMTIAQNVAFGLRMRGMKSAEAKARVQKALEMVQLQDYADRYPSALSGGQQQRVALARAFVIEPSLLLLDEPLGALDKNLREDMQVEIRQIQKRLGTTAVLVTHDQEEAMTMADRIVIMRSGKLEQVGTPSEVYSKPVSRFVAGFVGASNLLAARFIAHEGDFAVLELDGGLRIRVDRSPAVNRQCFISLRPEMITVNPAPAANTDLPVNAMAAQVEQIVYRGQSTHYHMRLPNGTPFLASRPNDVPGGDRRAIQVGDAVVAAWQQGCAHVIDERQAA
ncbi:polyamine ABC transporter ATP-binding protein [Bordetella genomosp. 10]|uniref:Spermidine/putrescine import ATP-binding protein PotA n=1 Tax=Bordetella genomosp. 10 TaxID=1416804 RepID=A0A261SKC6_9BORD|nr:ABC transporter ATP-binding protein [Bordetella genomosp. 10]OZI37210.1 polyamine ABC transporter ATP-binding protein [Bordetella genomosp. 10]